MGTYKHYIKVDGGNFIIDAFSSAFRGLTGGEIEVADTNERHFNLQLFDEFENAKYKWEDPNIVEVIIPARLSEYHDWDGSNWMPNVQRAKNFLKVYIVSKAQIILAMSDYIINRHRDEVEEGESTTITNTEFLAELTRRRQVRVYVDNQLIIVQNATTLGGLSNIKNSIDTKSDEEAIRLGYKI